ncbi:MAG: hypothetical protein RBT37_06585 [Dissulfurispiraceae bacterium]|nr:hypothetical protein [Dissulfurispiraceae bacterium]
MDRENLVHDLIVEHMRQKLSKDYSSITLNPEGSPDLSLHNHGLTMALVEVETESSITRQKADIWKDLASSGSKLIIMVPRSSKVRATELLWDKGIMDKVSVGSYEIVINMP